MPKSLLSLAALGAVLAGCSLAPAYERPAAPVASFWPFGSGQEKPSADAAAARLPPAADIGWRGFFQDPRLQGLIAAALANNRDLRIAALNVEAARAVPDRECGPAAQRQRHRGCDDAADAGRPVAGRSVDDEPDLQRRPRPHRLRGRPVRAHPQPARHGAGDLFLARPDAHGRPDLARLAGRQRLPDLAGRCPAPAAHARDAGQPARILRADARQLRPRRRDRARPAPGRDPDAHGRDQHLDLQPPPRHRPQPARVPDRPALAGGFRRQPRRRRGARPSGHAGRPARRIAIRPAGAAARHPLGRVRPARGQRQHRRGAPPSSRASR